MIFVVLGIVVVYLVLGFFGARISLLDLDNVFFAWLMFLTGPIGWIVAMISAGEGVRAEGHFLQNVRIPFFVFLSNKFGKGGVTKTIFRV